ncbi:MAG: hypothetical protein JXC32_03010 [Anaerolineae bacterium]|nr:hypothetical protein [Anaerolineae bacterium]
MPPITRASVHFVVLGMYLRRGLAAPAVATDIDAHGDPGPAAVSATLVSVSAIQGDGLVLKLSDRTYGVFVPLALWTCWK